MAAARLQGENALAGDDVRRRTAIHDMLGQITRLDTLAGELLAMTQRVQPQPERLDISPFLHAVAAGHQEVAASRLVALQVAECTGRATLDPAVVRRILDNLLTNAIRHAGEGGAVTLAAHCEAGTLAISVADTGPGVAADVAESLFEPFVTSRADGTGLGLAIARELADAHGGRLALQSADDAVPGRGAVFVLELLQEAE